MDLGGFFKPKTNNTASPQKPCEIPKLNPVMMATRGATDALSGVCRQVNNSWSKLGANNIQLGIGYGVGFGHGFGVGLGMRSGLFNEIQSFLVVAMTKMMMKFGLTPRPSLPLTQGAFPASTKSAISTVNTNQISAGSMMELATKSANQVSQGLAGSQPMNIGSTFQTSALKGSAVDSAFGSPSEKDISNFPKNPLLKEGVDETVGRLQSENKILQKVLKQKKIIEELVEENEKLRQILLEDLNISSDGLQEVSSGTSPTPKGVNDSN